MTRSASPTPEQRSDTSSHSSSQGIYRFDDDDDDGDDDEDDDDEEEE